MKPAIDDARGAHALCEDDERSLLARLEQLLDREEALLAAQDAEGMVALAAERERLSASLGVAAAARRVRRANGSGAHLRTSFGDEEDSHEDAELIALYQRLRQRHEVRAQVVRRHHERAVRAAGVIAQAAHQPAVYGSDGRVAMRWAGA